MGPKRSAAGSFTDWRFGGAVLLAGTTAWIAMDLGPAQARVTGPVFNNTVNGAQSVPGVGSPSPSIDSALAGVEPGQPPTSGRVSAVESRSGSVTHSTGSYLAVTFPALVTLTRYRAPGPSPTSAAPAGPTTSAPAAGRPAHPALVSGPAPASAGAAPASPGATTTGQAGTTDHPGGAAGDGSQGGTAVASTPGADSSTAGGGSIYRLPTYPTLSGSSVAGSGPASYDTTAAPMYGTGMSSVYTSRPTMAPSHLNTSTSHKAPLSLRVNRRGPVQRPSTTKSSGRKAHTSVSRNDRRR